MVPGIDSFREKFKDYTDYYTIIGGTACDILLSEADLPFRATKDIDMILIMEDNFPEFASVFWEYIKEGGYKCGWKNEQNFLVCLVRSSMYAKFAISICFGLVIRLKFVG